jgi:hypothetical protein
MVDDEAMLDVKEAARFMGIAVATLAKMRCLGGSPPYVKAGRKILCSKADLLAWLSARRIRNTAEGFALPPRVTGVASSSPKLR